MDFCALDVETANSERSSICQIGIARFRDGEVVAEWSELIHPRAAFEPYNTRIHGIDRRTVRNAPYLPRVWDDIRSFVGEDLIVAHSGFDRSAMDHAAERYQLDPLENDWLDSTKVVRGVWPQYRKSGYGLGNLARDFGISFQHHDALADARTCGIILVMALDESGTSLRQWQHGGPRPQSTGRRKGRRPAPR